MPNNKKNIIVVGSTNTDMVVKTQYFPFPGETVLGGDFFMTQGGKGANQAVAAARLGGAVKFITRLGDDIFGKEALRTLQQESIDISSVQIDENANSGVALITVDENAENSIVVAPGANANLKFSDDDLLRDLFTYDSILLVQLEIPLNTVDYVCASARSKGALVVLNPAPALPLNVGILKNVDIITPNQREATLLSGIDVLDEDSTILAAGKIHDLGPDTVIITLGKKGVYVSENRKGIWIPAVEVEAIDTTAAGDVFNGALVTALADGSKLHDAVKLASRAAALSVTRIGAQSSAPTREELSSFVN